MFKTNEDTAPQSREISFTDVCMGGVGAQTCSVRSNLKIGVLHGVKWDNYGDSYISGTQDMNTTPFCAGTQALVPGRLVRAAPI